MAYDEAAARLHETMPSDHLSFLNALETHTTYGDYFFTHAGVRPGVPLEEQREEDLIWIRAAFLNSIKNFGKVVVHGHTADRNIDRKPNQIGIDTAAYMTNVLTCLVLEGEDQRFIQTEA